MWIRLLLLYLLLSAGTAVFAAEPSIHSMVAGGKTLELVETRQLTFREQGDVSASWLSPNGKYVLYLTEASDEHWPQLAVVKATGGGHKVLLVSNEARALGAKLLVDGSGDWGLSSVYYSKLLSWSPNSAYICLIAGRFVPNNDVVEGGIVSLDREEDLLVIDVTGRIQAAIPVPEDYSDGLAGSLFWSQDSRKVACISYGPKKHKALIVADVQNKSVQALELDGLDESAVRIFGWSNSGNILINVIGKERNTSLEEVSLDGSRRVLADDYPSRFDHVSPDEKYRLSQKSDKLEIEAAASGQTVCKTQIPVHKFVNWAPNSRMFLYEQAVSLQDQSGARNTPLKTIWISSVEENKLNHMSVAMEAGELPTWSSDSLKIAYTNGRVYVAELAWRDATSQEKVATGLPLSEDEEKSILADYAKQIGAALAMYANDWDENLPQEDTFIEAINPYLRNKNCLYRPGTGEMVFKYFPQPTLGQIQNPAETVLGTIDIGYNWQVILYVDGHVITQQK